MLVKKRISHESCCNEHLTILRDAKSDLRNFSEKLSQQDMASKRSYKQDEPKLMYFYPKPLNPKPYFYFKP